MQSSNPISCGQLALYPNRDNSLQLSFSSVQGICYLGVKVTKQVPQNLLASGTAIFKVGNEFFVSPLEWYGPAYGFTERTIEQLAANQKTPEALGTNVVERMRTSTEQYLALCTLISPVMGSRLFWADQLSKTISYVQRHPFNMPAPQPGSHVKVKKGGVHRSTYVNTQDYTSPGFTLVRASSGRLYARINAIMFRTESKIFKYELELNSQTLVLRKKQNRFSPRAHLWSKEVQFAQKLIDAKASNVDLTGLFVPIDVIGNEIIELKAIGDLRLEFIANKMTVKERAKIAFEVAKGLETLHTVFKVAHRDLKPENVLRCADGSFRITDFEFITDSEDFNNGLDEMGTEKYIPPEFLKYVN